MDPKQLFMDERHRGYCAYCGAIPDSRDHVPSKVLVDEPYPPDLPVVSACSQCNESFSLSEQYIACLIECVLVGSTDPEVVTRPKIKRILADNPSLRKRIDESRRDGKDGTVIWYPEDDRVNEIGLMLARGHMAYELYPMLEDPYTVSWTPIVSMNAEQENQFEKDTESAWSAWPEIGTRAFSRLAGKAPDKFEIDGSWVIIQPGRYRYAVTESGANSVRIVMSEYLACWVIWQ